MTEMDPGTGLETKVAGAQAMTADMAGAFDDLKWGVGGYVGGRSLEKIAGAVVQSVEKPEMQGGFRRRFVRKRVM